MIHDAEYFRKWYRDPRHRVRTRAELDRQVRFVVSAAEHVLMRPIRSVLDLGAGEGAWQAALARVRPAARYWGVDPSEYAVRRFGRSRRIVLGDAESLDEVGGIPESVDLVVCASVLQYLTADGFRRALPQIARRTGGMAFLEIYTRRDIRLLEGHVKPLEQRARSAEWYRRELARAGLVACGMHCYITAEMSQIVGELERFR